MNSIESILHKHFEIDKIFNLVDYDDRLEDLYTDLATIVRHEYPNNYRFVFLHYDTDYYITNRHPGFLLRNLQRILVNLDIPNYFCIIITAQNIQEELEQLRREETRDSMPISAFVCAVQPLLHNLENETVMLSTDSVKAKYICLNRITRAHRTILYSVLKHKNLLGDGMVSYGTR